MENIIIKTIGMTCQHCEKRVEKLLMATEGVSSCKADSTAGQVSCQFDPAKTNAAAIKEVIEDAGFEVEA